MATAISLANGGFVMNDMYSSNTTAMMNVSSPSSVSQSSADSQDSTGMLHWLTPMVTTVSLSPLGLQTMSINDTILGPHLVIREQPVDKFRFRYKSEMLGTHGSIVGRNSEKYRKKTYPTVELLNYNGTGIIRCSLYTAEQRSDKRSLHTHRLVVRQGTEDKDDPHDILVSPEEGYIAMFQGMGIIHTAKKHVVDELIKKKRTRLLERYRTIGRNGLSTKDDVEIRAEAEIEAKHLNLNSVSLCFEAFEQEPNGTLKPLCDPVYSCSINNMKSALTGELKICRIDKHACSCVGGDEVFILVEKVGKKNIRIKFFEVDEEDNEVWYDYGKFSELDVHHQYAIVFRTPPYKCQDIEKPVDVYIQLYRPTDGDCSEPIKFQYKPAEKIAGRPTRKRHRSAEMSSREFDNINDLNLLNLSKHLTNAGTETLLTNNYDPVLSSGSSGEFEKLCNEPAEHKINSAEFHEYLTNLTFSGDFTAYMPNEEDQMDMHNMIMDITVDGVSSKPLSKKSGHRRGKFHGDKNKKFASSKKLPKMEEEVEDVKEMAEESEPEDNAINKVAREVVDAFGAMLKGKPLSKEATERVAGQLLKRCSDGMGPLHAAVVKGNLEPFKLILSSLHEDEQPTIINDKNDTGNTLLHMGVIYNRPLHVVELLKQGANANILNSNGESVVHLAIVQDFMKCLEELLDPSNYPVASNRPDLDKFDDDGETYLHMATRKKNLKAVELLVKAGCNVNEQTQKQGNTALHIAVEENSLEIVRFLVQQAKAEIDARNLAGNTPLHISCVVNGTGSVEICRFLLQNNADPYKANYIIEHQKQKAKTSYCNTSNEEEDEEDTVSPLELVAVKEEPVSEDELRPSAAEDDDDEDDEDDEDDDEEEAYCEASQGQTSFDLASDKKEILDLLQQTEHCDPRSESPATLVVVKQEPEDIPTTAADTAEDDEKKLPLDEETHEKICALLDSKKLWQKLAEMLDYNFLIPCIELSKSPTSTLLSYQDINGSTLSAHQLREHLAAMGEDEGVVIIDEMFLIRRVKANLRKLS